MNQTKSYFIIKIENSHTLSVLIHSIYKNCTNIVIYCQNIVGG